MSKAIENTSLFKPMKVPARDKAEQTTLAARAIMDAETEAREKKTLRLRNLRLAQEAAEAAPAQGSDEKPGKTSAKTTAAKKPAKAVAKKPAAKTASGKPAAKRG